jgi:hypothetical protein
MNTSIFFSITLLLIAYFLTMKKLHRHINTFLFLLIINLNINFFIIIGENFKKKELTQEIDPYISFLLWRNILIPLIIVIGTHYFFYTNQVRFRLLSTCVTVGTLFGMGKVCQKLDFYHWKQWHDLFSFGYYLLLFCIAILAVFIIRKTVKIKMWDKP